MSVTNQSGLDRLRYGWGTASTANGSQVEIWPCGGGRNQQWNRG